MILTRRGFLGAVVGALGLRKAKTVPKKEPELAQRTTLPAADWVELDRLVLADTSLKQWMDLQVINQHLPTLRAPHETPQDLVPGTLHRGPQDAG